MKGLTDIEGIRVGHATDLEGLTGCTVILCERGAVGGLDVRGSATGSEELDLLREAHIAEHIHAVVLTGGSAFGLESASGVRRYLEQRGVGFKTAAGPVPLVVGAVIYDLGIGKASARPTREMGEAAAGAASDGPVREGVVGAGTGATVGKLFGRERAMKSGVGAATVWLDGPWAGVRVSALAVVNALGDVRDPETGQLLAGARESRESWTLVDSAAGMKRGVRGGIRGTNTTLAVVATNARLSKAGAGKLAQFGSLGLARTITPVWTTSDGDITFALSCGGERADLDALGVAAAEAVGAAIARSVRLAVTTGGVPGLASRIRSR